jgi:hypothetical protein
MSNEYAKDVEALAMHCKTYGDGEIWEAACRVLRFLEEDCVNPHYTTTSMRTRMNEESEAVRARCFGCPDPEACSQGGCHLDGGPVRPEGKYPHQDGMSEGWGS